MALTLGDNFSYQGAKPLDARLKYDTLTAMKAVADSTMYDGCLAYCVATDKTYQWKSTNEVDPDTGKWIEYSSGGGHEIKNNGAAVTDRKVMNFTDFDIADDSTNEETDIKAHRLTQAEMTEIMSTLPGAPSISTILFDERGTEYQIGWYVFANGTKKPVYEKSISTTSPSATGSTTNIATLPANIDTVISLDGVLTRTGFVYPINYTNDNSRIVCWLRTSENAIAMNITNADCKSQPVRINLQYTKTTDTPSA